MAAELPVYINEGYILVLKGMDKIYGLLLDILNMRYKTENQKQKSKLIFDDKERVVHIGDNFRIIILQGYKNDVESDIDNQLTGEAYSPFQNRLEKYFISLTSLTGDNSIDEKA